MPKDMSQSGGSNSHTARGTAVRAQAQAPQKEKIVPKEQTFDAFRPVRTVWAFVTGTMNGTLQGMSYLGRKGMWFGLGVGVLVGIASGGFIGAAFLGAAAGLAGGAVVGGAVGAGLGGFRNVGREHRKEKYANDLAQRQRARGRIAVQGTAPNYNDVDEARRRTAAYNFERSQQQERENDRDYMRYWQDREERGHGGGFGRGF